MTVFCVLAHDQPQRLARLVDRLTPHHVIIHVDATSDRTSILRALDTLSAPRVEVLPLAESVDVRWAGFSICEATFRLLSRALEHVSGGEEYVGLLSGADYPLHPMPKLDAFLKVHQGTQWIRYFDSTKAASAAWSTQRWHAQDWAPLGTGGVTRRRMNTAIRQRVSFVMTRLSQMPSPPDGIRPAFGSQFFFIDGHCTADALGRRTPEMDRYFQRTFAPDEKYIHTLVSMGPYHASTPNGGYETPPVGPWPDVHKMANLHYIPPELSRVWVDFDWPEVLSASANSWFLRKVSLPESRLLLRMIDEFLLFRTT